MCPVFEIIMNITLYFFKSFSSLCNDEKKKFSLILHTKIKKAGKGHLLLLFYYFHAIATTYYIYRRKFCFQERKLFGQPKRAKVYDGWARGARAHRNVDQNKFYWVSFYFGDCLILMPSLTKLPTYFELSELKTIFKFIKKYWF